MRYVKTPLTSVRGEPENTVHNFVHVTLMSVTIRLDAPWGLFQGTIQSTKFLRRDFSTYKKVKKSKLSP
jgi:hypothetical protein